MAQIHTFAFVVEYDNFTKIVPIDVPSSCVFYAENALIAAHANEQKMPKIGFSLYIGWNLAKVKHTTRLAIIAEALQKTFA